MQAPPAIPMTRDLVLIGGGHTHALVLKSWAMNPLAGARLTIINPGPTAPYTGMLPGFIAGHYSRAALDIDLMRLARQAGARIVLGKAEAIDRRAQTVLVAGRAPIAYDVAALDIGITSDLPDLPGFAAHGVSAKPLGGYADAWARFLERLRQGDAAPRVAVLGAGVAGVELALAMAFRLRAEGHRPAVTLIEAASRALPHLGARARARLLRHLDRMDIALIEGARATGVGPEGVTLDDRREIAASLTLGAAGSRPQDWLGQTGLHLTNGYVTVGPTLQSVTDSAIFAAGDCAHLSHAPRAKAGVYAVRAAPVLHANLRAALSGRPLRRYDPQRDYLKLISTGGKSAVADKWGLPLEGRWLWQLKDRIDDRFMSRLNRVRPMPAPLPPAEAAEGVAEALAGGKPLCGGCGAKTGADTLRDALSGLPGCADPAILLGAGDDAAVLARPGGGQRVFTTDHLRAFTEDPWAMGRLAAIHALGDVWAMGAQPQAALATVILPRLSDALQGRTLREILDGAASVLAAEGACIVGGHTSVGAELTVGFAMTGTIEGAAVRKGGLVPGQALVLTKAIGTGTVLAAAMADAAPGEAVAATLAAMGQAQGDAAAILAPEAAGMTDVTGFGLAGHLHEMAAAGPCARVVLRLDAVPILPGAEALAAAGHASSLAPSNRAAIAARIALPDTPRAALLVDPQTCGGLLASVPAARAEALVAALRAAGHAAAAVIGQVEEGPPEIVVLP